MISIFMRYIAKRNCTKIFLNYLHGISFFPLSRQQKHDTPHAITTMRITETQPTIKSSFKLIWQFLPANQARQSQLTWASLLMTHWPFLLHKSHSVVVAVEMKSRIWYFCNIKQQLSFKLNPPSGQKIPRRMDKPKFVRYRLISATEHNLDA